MSEGPEVLSKRSTLGSQIAVMAGLIGAPHYPSGDRAALRRWAPGQPVPMAFYRLWLRHIAEELPPSDQLEAWVALAWGLAMCGEGAHEPRRSLGQALAESGYSEGRLERLLSAPDDVRMELFMSAVRFLAAKGERFDWQDAAQFLLTHDRGKRDLLHRRIAAAYFRYLPQRSDRKE